MGAFKAIPAIPHDEHGPWIDQGGNYVFRSTGWELNPELAQKKLLDTKEFIKTYDSLVDTFTLHMQR